MIRAFFARRPLDEAFTITIDFLYVDNIRPGRVSLANDNPESPFVDSLPPSEVQRFKEISTQSLGLSPRELVLLIRADCQTLYNILRLGPKDSAGRAIAAGSRMQPLFTPWKSTGLMLALGGYGSTESQPIMIDI